jgi:ADP-heptose:LPS heptosyltransferase
VTARRGLLRRLRRRVNRRLYRLLFRLYRRLFPTPRWTGRVPAGSLRRILIVRDDRVGDMVLTTPLFSFLREEAPQAEIDVLASRANAAIVRHDPRVAQVFVHDRRWRSWTRLLPRMRARRYDVVLNPIGRHPFRQGLVSSVLAGRRTYKVSGWRPVRFQGLFTKAFRIPPRLTHVAESTLAIGQLALGRREMIGREGLRRYPVSLPPNAESDGRIAAFIAAHQLQQFVVVNVSAGVHRLRDWPPEQAAAVASQILSRHDRVSIVVTPAPGRENDAAEVGRRCADGRVLVSPVFSLLDLIAFVRRALMVVTPDTALVHIASATGRPVIALYAPQHPKDVPLWLPLGVPYRALASGLGGTVADIPSHQVIDAFDEMVAEMKAPDETGRAPR